MKSVSLGGAGGGGLVSCIPRAAYLEGSGGVLCAQQAGMATAGGPVQLITVLVGAGSGHVQGCANDLGFCVVTLSGQRDRGTASCPHSPWLRGKYWWVSFDLPPVGFNARLSHLEGRCSSRSFKTSLARQRRGPGVLALGKWAGSPVSVRPGPRSGHWVDKWPGRQ